MGTIRKILERRAPVTNLLSPKHSVRQAVEMMVHREVGIVGVIEEGKLVGVFSERDLLRRVVFAGRDLDRTTLREVMTADLVTASPDDLRKDALRRMQERMCRHLPVLEGDRFLDMISMRDLLKDALADSRIALQEMRKYIQEGR